MKTTIILFKNNFKSVFLFEKETKMQIFPADLNLISRIHVYNFYKLINLCILFSITLKK